MSWRDAAHLLDMLLAARQIQEFMTEKTWDDFMADDMLQSAVIFGIEILGRSAEKVSESQKLVTPFIPWQRLVETGQHLVEDYYQVDWEKVRQIVVNDLDLVIRQLEPLVPPEDTI